MSKTTFQQEYQKILAERENCDFIRKFDELKKPLDGRPLALYGAGKVGGAVLDICQERNVPVACICDRKATGTLNGVPIVDLQTLKSNFADATVLIGSVIYHDEIVKDLTNLGFAEERLIPYFMSNKSRFASLSVFQQYLDGYAWAYDFFEDETSKQTVINRLRWYLCEIPIEINTTCEQYFESDFIKLDKDEVYIDGGAYDGDTVIQFIKNVKSANGSYAHIYAFEPFPNSYAKMAEAISQYPNVSVIPKGLWNTDTELPIYENINGPATYSFIAKVTANSSVSSNIAATSLDNFFADKDDSELPTFIKMDIEGSEKEALLGAAGIIRRKKPKLAICAYHKPEDVYELPKTILDIGGYSRFALRHYKLGPTETVLYAV